MTQETKQTVPLGYGYGDGYGYGLLEYCKAIAGVLDEPTLSESKWRRMGARNLSVVTKRAELLKSVVTKRAELLKSTPT